VLCPLRPPTPVASATSIPSLARSDQPVKWPKENWRHGQATVGDTEPPIGNRLPRRPFRRLRHGPRGHHTQRHARNALLIAASLCCVLAACSRSSRDEMAKTTMRRYWIASWGLAALVVCHAGKTWTAGRASPGRSAMGSIQIDPQRDGRVAREVGWGHAPPLPRITQKTVGQGPTLPGLGCRASAPLSGPPVSRPVQRRGIPHAAPNTGKARRQR